MKGTIKMFVRIKYSIITCICLVVSMSLIAGSLTDKSVELNDRALIFKALTNQKILTKGRKLVHLVHLCNLVIDNKIYPMVDIKEHVKGAQVPRGVNQIILFDSTLKLVKKISYDGASNPLYCKDNQLFLYGEIMIDGLMPEGNILTFSDAGKKVIVSEMADNDFPPQNTLQ